MADPRSREHAVAASGIVLFTMLLYLPIFFHKTYSMVGSHMLVQFPWQPLVQPTAELSSGGSAQTDEAETFYPLHAWATNTIRSGEFPLWMAYSFGGFPLIELGLHDLFYPPRLLLMPWLDPPAQHDFMLIAHLLLGAFGMYALCRTIGLGPIAGLFAATIWQANGHNAFWFVLEHICLATAWLPWSLLTATLAVRRNSTPWAILCGLTVGMSLLTGSIQVVYVGGLLLAAWYGGIAARRALALRKEGQSWLRILTLPVISLTVALAVSAALWIPMAASLRSVYREPLRLALQVGQKERVPPRVLVRNLLFPSADEERAAATFAFVGVPALALAFGAMLYNRSRQVILLTILAIVSAAMAVGFTPLIIVLRRLPFFAAIHIFYGSYLLVFALALLAAVQITRLEAISASHRAVVWSLLIALLAVNSVQLVGFFRRINPQQPRSAKWFDPETPAIRAARSAQDSYRVLPLYYHRKDGQWTPPVLAGKTAAIFGLRSGSGYESLLPVYVAGLWRTIEQGGTLATLVTPAYRPYFLHDRLRFDLLEKISVGLLIAPPGVEPVGIDDPNPERSGRIERIYSGPDAWVYRVSAALPRAFLVGRGESVPNAPDALRLFFDPSFNARDAAVFIRSVPPGLTGIPVAGSARIVKDRQNSVGIVSSAAAPAVLVLQDTWDDDWKAFIDGKSSPVYRVNYAFRGVVVPAGTHRVDFVYRPTSVRVGLLISVASLIGSVAMAGWMVARARSQRAAV